MEHKLCDCPNDIPASAASTASKKASSDLLPPRPNRAASASEPHFKIGGKTSPGRFSRHFLNLSHNLGREDDERTRSEAVPEADRPPRPPKGVRIC
jgi:hypothetical protein